MNKTLEEMLYEALKDLHDEQVEYVIKNNLGLPHHNQTMRNALIAMTLYKENEALRIPKATLEGSDRQYGDGGGSKYVGKHT
jgi:hypothetical protein